MAGETKIIPERLLFWGIDRVRRLKSGWNEQGKLLLRLGWKLPLLDTQSQLSVAAKRSPLGQISGCHTPRGDVVCGRVLRFGRGGGSGGRERVRQ